MNASRVTVIATLTPLGSPTALYWHSPERARSALERFRPPSGRAYDDWHLPTDGTSALPHPDHELAVVVHPDKVTPTADRIHAAIATASAAPVPQPNCTHCTHCKP